MSLPSSMSSSFCAFDSEIVTPSNMSTCRTFWRALNNCSRHRLLHTFSPKKLRISTDWPSSWIMQLIGKWAYTARILYRKPWKRISAFWEHNHKFRYTFVTPVTMLLMRLRIVRRQATCLRPPDQTARLTLVVLPFNNRISMSTWRMFFFSVPRGPVTVMRRDLMEISTFSGMISSSVLRTLRICLVEGISKISSELNPSHPTLALHRFLQNRCQTSEKVPWTALDAKRTSRSVDKHTLDSEFRIVYWYRRTWLSSRWRNTQRIRTRLSPMLLARAPTFSVYYAYTWLTAYSKWQTDYLAVLTNSLTTTNLTISFLLIHRYALKTIMTGVRRPPDIYLYKSKWTSTTSVSYNVKCSMAKFR